MKNNGKIIYKFTIIAKYKMDGCKPFYVGQYTGKRFDLYWGSGSIWGDFVKKLKQDFPNFWKKFIKREILYQGNCSQSVLDKLEEIYIRKEHALYSEGLGGCNVLPGAANGIGKNNPSVVLKNKPMSEEHKNKIRISSYNKHNGNKNPMFGVHRYGVESPMFGKHHSEETKKRMSASGKGKHGGLKGIKFTEEHKAKLSKAAKLRWSRRYENFDR